MTLNCGKSLRSVFLYGMTIGSGLVTLGSAFPLSMCCRKVDVRGCNVLGDDRLGYSRAVIYGVFSRWCVVFPFNRVLDRLGSVGCARHALLACSYEA